MIFFNRILPYIKTYRKYAFLNIFFNVFYAIFSGLSFFLIIPLLSVIFNPEQRILKAPIWEGPKGISTYLKDYITYNASTLAEKNGTGILNYIIIAIIIVFLLKNIFGYLANYNIVFLREYILKDIRLSFYKKVIQLPIGYYSEKRKGDIISRLSNDVNTMQYTYLNVLELLIREPLTILISLLIMLSTSVKLTLFIFVFIPLSGLIISKIGKSLRKHSEKAQQGNGHFLSLFEETLSGLKIIKGFNAESEFIKKFTIINKSIFTHFSKLQHRNNLASPVSEFLGISVFAVLLWYGGYLVFTDKSLSGEEFMGFLALAYNILTPAKSLSKASYNIEIGNASAQRVFEIIDKETSIPNTPNATVKKDFTTSINLEKVSFKYQETPVIEDLNLIIERGKVIAFVGQSGSGKSTIANLLTRFYNIQSGAITIDGIDIKKITKKSLRDLIGIVTQDDILFNDTIKQNLLLAKNDATDKQVIEALKIANAWEFVKILPNGINTNIGESGNKLSGGQKQRLAIARAVIKNPPIMILDEATSALDTESEKLVQIALENMMKNRTSIVIAHRLSTIQNADTIVVMKKGKIIEKGNHAELLHKNGIYTKLVAMQQL